MNVWKMLCEMFLIEIEDEYIDYPQGQAHPALAKKRDDMRKAVEWVAKSLDQHGTPEMKRLAVTLRGVPDLPSERVAGVLSNIHKDLHTAKRLQKKVNPEAAKAVEDALQAMPSILGAAAKVGKSVGSDEDLWKTRMKGYVDDKTGEFRAKTRVTEPIGYEPQMSADDDGPGKPKKPKPPPLKGDWGARNFKDVIGPKIVKKGEKKPWEK